MPISTRYAALIDQLLTYETFEQINTHFNTDDTLLERPLLLALADRQPADEDKRQSLQWLMQMLTYLYGRKCLFTFVNMAQKEAVAYAQTHAETLLTDANYELLKNLITQHRDHPDEFESLQNKQSLLATIAAHHFLVIDDWPAKRALLLAGFKWLTNPAVKMSIPMKVARYSSENLPPVDKYKKRKQK